MTHIQNEFNQIIQYVCISSPSSAPQTLCPPLMYIQIILQKIINKKTYFFNAVAGLNLHRYSSNTCISSLFVSGRQCNYQVTYDDRTWNSFLKKDFEYFS